MELILKEKYTGNTNTSRAHPNTGADTRSTLLRVSRRKVMAWFTQSSSCAPLSSSETLLRVSAANSILTSDLQPLKILRDSLISDPIMNQKTLHIWHARLNCTYRVHVANHNTSLPPEQYIPNTRTTNCDNCNKKNRNKGDTCMQDTKLPSTSQGQKPRWSRDK